MDGLWNIDFEDDGYDGNWLDPEEMDEPEIDAEIDPDLMGGYDLD